MVLIYSGCVHVDLHVSYVAGRSPDKSNFLRLQASPVVFIGGVLMRGFDCRCLTKTVKFLLKVVEGCCYKIVWVNVTGARSSCKTDSSKTPNCSHSILQVCHPLCATL